MTLDACPFCGGPAIAGNNKVPYVLRPFFIYCATCAALVSGKDTDEAELAWNRRPPPAIAPEPKLNGSMALPTVSLGTAAAKWAERRAAEIMLEDDVARESPAELEKSLYLALLEGAGYGFQESGLVWRRALADFQGRK